MAKEPTRGGKTESLTIRLDPKTRFILEYMSRLKGQNITTVVERAIVSAATDEKIQAGDEYSRDTGWQDLWDVSEGVRALAVSRIAAFFPTYEEERRLAFVKDHWPFFYTRENQRVPLNHFIDILWPRIDEFVQMHDDSKAAGSDWFATGKTIQEVLRKANFAPPDWPPKREIKPEPIKPESKQTGNFSREQDDDIPF